MTICSWSDCSKLVHRPNQRYCRSHHAEYNRNWRRGRQLSPSQAVKAAARTEARLDKRRNNIVAQPCSNCGEWWHVEMHHHDYTQPLDIVALCRSCHVAQHVGTMTSNPSL